jgi:hypothetical protein
MSNRPIRARIVGAVVAFSLVATVLSVVASPSTELAEAANLSGFDPGLIITDELFYNPNTMTAAEIQSFMESKDPDCVDYTYMDGVTPMMCIQDYSAKVPARDANSNCAAIPSSTSKSASAILYLMATACGINPQVLLVLLQKEEDLILNAHSEGRYQIAAGYGCPDTAACASKYKGYANQLYNAAYSFKQWHKPLTRQFMPYKNNTIRYSPNAKCGSTTVYIKNYATAALYTYTPYVPNRAALAAGYGYGDSCSAYGNRNFYNYFADWFGNPGNLLKNASFSDKTSYWKSGSTGFMDKTSVSDALRAQSGTRYLEITASSPGRRLQQDVKKNASVGSVYTAGVWMRAEDDAATVDGVLKLGALGGTSEYASIPFTADSTWRYYSVNLAINKSHHTKLRFNVELTTANTALRVDSTSAFFDAKVAPRATFTIDEQHTNSSGYGKWRRSSTSAVKVSRTKGPPTVGTYNGTLTTSKSGQYIAQYVKYSAKQGTSYTYGVWLRSAAPGSTYSGTLRLSGIGGIKESAYTPFTVGDQWEFHTVTIDMTHIRHTRLGVYIYPDTVGGKLYFDQPELTTNLVGPDATFDVDGSSLSTPPDGTVIAFVPGDDTIGAAVDGSGFLHVTRTTADASDVHFQVVRTTGVGETYRFEVWVKSAVPGTTFDGAVVLEGRTGATGYELVEQPFTATDVWTRAYVDYTVGTADLTRLRASVRLDSDGADIYVDGAKLN